jgi:hypothetical protein
MTHEHHQHHIDLWFQNYPSWVPHAHCVLYDPAIIFLDFWGNILVGVSYMLITAFLYRLILGMWIVMPSQFRPLIIHGGAFVFLCGLTHFVHAWNWYHASYALQSILELVTGVVSIWFTFSLFFFIRGRKWESR